MKRFHLIAVSLLCLGATAANAQLSRGPFHGQDEMYAQREDVPPSWAIGNWVGRNDFRHNDVDLQIGQDGRATLTYRTGTRNSQTLRGRYRSGNLEFGGDRYSLRA